MRGLCSECAVDLDRGLACKNRCEHEARRLLDLRDFSFAQPGQQEAILKRSKRAFQNSGLYSLIVGLAFVIWGYFNPATTFFLMLGVFMSVYGLWSLVTNRVSPQSDQFRLCQKCGYNITGNTSGKCPECGFQV